MTVHGRLGNGGAALRLYHGSKNGLQGEIRPISRDRCDFGRGFYMGTERNQPLTLICNYPTAVLYTLDADFSDLTVLTLQADIDWAMLVAINRGKLDSSSGGSLYRRICDMRAGCDVIVGPIANDRMFVVLDRFFEGSITDVALVNSLSALRLGLQYVAVTDRACKRISVVDSQALSEAQRSALKTQSEANRLEGVRLADEICRSYRREGRYFDEIIEGER